MVRYNIIFKGRVQGVGFRYRAKMIADKIGITGNVKNLYNGDVECNVQGDEEKITSFIEKLNDSWFINIEDTIISNLEIIDEEGFYIK